MSQSPRREAGFQPTRDPGPVPLPLVKVVSEPRRIPVSPEVEDRLTAEWSEPVQIRIADGEIILRSAPDLTTAVQALKWAFDFAQEQDEPGLEAVIAEALSKIKGER